jgi:hypothetical protein
LKGKGYCEAHGTRSVQQTQTPETATEFESSENEKENEKRGV